MDIEVYDGNDDSNKGVSFTLIEHEGTFNSTDSCTTISTNEFGANSTGSRTLKYQETDTGVGVADIDDCTGDYIDVDLAAYVSLPDSDGAGAGDSRITGELRVFDTDNDGCYGDL